MGMGCASGPLKKGWVLRAPPEVAARQAAGEASAETTQLPSFADSKHREETIEENLQRNKTLEVMFRGDGPSRVVTRSRLRGPSRTLTGSEHVHTPYIVFEKAYKPIAEGGIT